MSDTRATEALLDALHGMVADSLVDELRRAVYRAKMEPDNPDMAIPPQLLDKAMKFLAQNGINAPASAKRVDTLAAELAAIEIDPDDVQLRH